MLLFTAGIGASGDVDDLLFTAGIGASGDVDDMMFSMCCCLQLVLELVVM